MVVVADGALAAGAGAGALGPGWFAARELAERRELGFPPAVRMASADRRRRRRSPTCSPPPGCRTAPRCSARCRPARARSGCWCGCPGRPAAALAAALHAAAGGPRARKAADPVRIQVDPLSLF